MFDPLIPVLVYLLTAGVKDFCAQVLHRDIGAAESALVAAFVSALVLFANGAAKVLPPDVLPALGQVVALVVMIASAFGIKATVRSVAK